MALDPDLRIIVNGDSAKVFRRGDSVTGTIVLAAGEEVDVSSLVLSFMGTVTTVTSRPFYPMSNNANGEPSARQVGERVTLFNLESELLSRCTLDDKKRSWTFEFEFPSLTIPKYPRFHHGPKYSKGPHPLPPSFQTCIDNFAGSATISYFLKATFKMDGTREPLKIYHVLPYHPTPEHLNTETRIVSRVLYAQTWKPISAQHKSVDRAFSRLTRRNATNSNSPRIVPTVYYPEKTMPGQHIPISLSLVDKNELLDADDTTRDHCELESVNISIGTHTTSICGHPASHAEDTMSKYVTCIDRKHINQTINFGDRINLTHNFRLVDDAECVPSFKTYIVTRSYDLIVKVGVKYRGREFGICSKTALEILPRIPCNLISNSPGSEEIQDDPLPLYTPRESSKELAPDYFSIYGHTRGLSNYNSSSASLPSSDGRSRGSSMTSGLSTPASEPEQAVVYA
ncbi:unnamed protein product [Periconia digitata]|uniref:Arrestin-like N-terminal domain-containing protein n=1 Tax=Periconia digitata TaxID=1303443 RepID=A0A9W4U3Z4_9PLEO|nr:unnamed protein product [Periconia digitata]